MLELAVSLPDILTGGERTAESSLAIDPVARQFFHCVCFRQVATTGAPCGLWCVLDRPDLTARVVDPDPDRACMVISYKDPSLSGFSAWTACPQTSPTNSRATGGHHAMSSKRGRCRSRQQHSIMPNVDSSSAATCRHFHLCCVSQHESNTSNHGCYHCFSFYLWWDWGKWTLCR